MEMQSDEIIPPLENDPGPSRPMETEAQLVTGTAKLVGPERSWIALSDRVVIGRHTPGTAADPAFFGVSEMRNVSRNHVEVVYHSGKREWQLITKSKNGVKVDNEHVAAGANPVPLRHQACISINMVDYFWLYPVNSWQARALAASRARIKAAVATKAAKRAAATAAAVGDSAASQPKTKRKPPTQRYKPSKMEQELFAFMDAEAAKAAASSSTPHDIDAATAAPNTAAVQTHGAQPDVGLEAAAPYQHGEPPASTVNMTFAQQPSLDSSGFAGVTPVTGSSLQPMVDVDIEDVDVDDNY